MERKQKLIEALKRERAAFVDWGFLALEHDIAIEYLETGKTNREPEEYELLYEVMHDYDTVCSAYGV